MARRTTSFFPRAEAHVLRSKYELPRTRPDAIAPIFDVAQVDKPLAAWSEAVNTESYPPAACVYDPAPIPEEQADAHATNAYLSPTLTRNERLRLTMLWYYTRSMFEDDELLSRLQEKVHLVQETIGWEFVIIGLMDADCYIRVATFGLPLAILPRRESTCAHTINQTTVSVFLLPNMAKDWRFRASPHVEIGGLRAYAGTTLRLETEFGDDIALGSLCVASNTAQGALSKAQQQTLMRFADEVVTELVHTTRTSRQRHRNLMVELLAKIHRQQDSDHAEEMVMEILAETYPNASVYIQVSRKHEISLEGRRPILFSEVDHGLWEDSEYLDQAIASLKRQDLFSTQVVRVLAARCASALLPTFVIVASREFRLVFDDVDAWFVEECASLLCRIWQERSLKDALRAKERFLRGITHQLRTPIHGILGSVELLAEELKARNLLSTVTIGATSTSQTFDASLFIKTIKTSGRELMSTVNNMINLNRWAELNDASQAPQFFDIRQLESDVMGDLLQSISDEDFSDISLFFVHSLPDRCDGLTVNLALLKDSIQPLIRNAIQYTTSGFISVEVSVSENFKSLRVDVQDTGCGIHPDDQRRVFHPYEKADVHTSGAGLGLTLASKFATLLDGSVSLISSEVNVGSHFRAEFNEPGCACSMHPPVLLSERLKCIPTVFYTISSQSTSLTCYFAKYLVRHGFKQSATMTDSLVVIDYISDAERFVDALRPIAPNQVAICLVSAPANTTHLQHVLPDHNIIYLKGPFLTSLMDKALEQADSILAATKTGRRNVSHTNDARPTPLNNDHTLKQDKVPSSPQQSPTTTECINHRDSPNSISIYNQSIEIASPVMLPASPPPPSMPAALLVDDNPVNLRIMQMYCEKRGLPYCSANDGAQAVTMFKCPKLPPPRTSQAIDLILMDLQMPVCDGLEACERIRAIEKEKNTKPSVIFIVTGQDSPSDRAKAVAAGANEFFVKPIGPKALDRGIRGYFPAL